MSHDRGCAFCSADRGETHASGCPRRTIGKVKELSRDRDAEEFYDKEIAPELLRLAKMCQARGISLVAMCEWLPGETGQTAVIADAASVEIKMVRKAMLAKGNADSLIWSLLRYGKKHGHNSVCLRLLEENT